MGMFDLTLDTSLPTDPYQGLRPIESPTKKKSFLDTLGLIADDLTGGFVRRANEYQGAREALQGLVDNPLAAIQKLTQVNPSAGLKAYENYQTNDVNRGYKEAVLDEQRSRQDDLQAQRQAVLKEKALTRVTDMIRAAASDNTGRAWKAALPVIRRYADSSGVDLSAFNLPEEYNPDTMKWLSGLGVTAGQLLSDQNADDRTGIAERNAEIAAAGLGLREQEQGNIVRTIQSDDETYGVTRNGQVIPLGVKPRRGRRSYIESVLFPDKAKAPTPAPKPTPKAAPAPTKSFKPGQIVYKNGRAYKVNPDGKTAVPLD